MCSCFAVCCGMFSLFAVCHRCVFPPEFEKQNKKYDLRNTRDNAHATYKTRVTTHTTIPTPPTLALARPRTHSVHDTGQRNNKQRSTSDVQHTTHNKHTKGSHAPGRQLPGSWHMGTLHMRQPSVQMRLEGMNSFACLVALMIVARRSNSCEAPILPRMFHYSFLEPRCMYCAPEVVHLHGHRSPPWCVWSLVVLGESAALPRGPNCPIDCAIKTVRSNNGVFSCSTTNITTQKNGHVLHVAQTLLLSLSARRTASSPYGAYRRKCSYPACSVVTTIPRASHPEPPNHSHGASFVEPNDSRHFHASYPSFPPCIRAYCRPSKLRHGL